MENTHVIPPSDNTIPESTLSKEQIVNWYMTDVLEGNDPKNVYLFSKNHGIQEADFYVFFNDFEGVKKYFFELIAEKTIATLNVSEQYNNYASREKLLSFYYTAFGNFTANRSFVLHLLSRNKFENLRLLSGFRKRFIDYVRTLDIEKLNLKQKDLNRFQDRAMEEGAWAQFLVIFKFWLQDSSTGFEKTDVFIEKAVTAGFDVLNVKPLKSIADLGKFIFKEFNPVL